jgi:outer membrane protein
MRGMMKAAAVAVAGLMAALPAGAETLADAMVAAYRNSPLLDQNQAVLRAADEDLAGAVARLRPVVTLNGQIGAFRTESLYSERTAATQGLSTSLTLSAELALYDFGRGKLGVEIARESVLATRQDLVSTEQQVLFDVVNAYVTVRLRQEIVALRQNNVRLITQELRAARDRFEVGEITRTDVAIAEARLAEARSRLASAEGDLKVARESYKLAVGAYPGALAPLPKSPRIGKSLDEALATARQRHPFVLKAQHLVKVADLQVELAKAAMKPTVGLSGSVRLSDTDISGRQNEGRDQFDLNVGLGVNQTLYAGGALSSSYRRALAGKEAQRAGLHRTVAQVEQSVAAAWAGLEVFVASIEASNRQIEAAQTAFDGVKEEATLGARTTLDVLDAEQELLDARALRLEAEAGRYIAVYQILGNMGLLTARDLGLGVPLYDPEAYFDAVKRAPATSAQGKKLDEILKKIGN